MSLHEVFFKKLVVNYLLARPFCLFILRSTLFSLFFERFKACEVIRYRVEEQAFFLKKMHFHTARDCVVICLHNFLLMLSFCMEFFEKVSFILTSILRYDLLCHSKPLFLDSFQF